MKCLKVVTIRLCCIQCCIAMRAVTLWPGDKRLERALWHTLGKLPSGFAFCLIKKETAVTF